MLQNWVGSSENIKKTKRKPNPFSQRPWRDSRAEKRKGCKAAFPKAGMDTWLHGCRAAKLLPGNSMNHEWSLDPPHSVHTLSFMRLDGAVHIPTPTLLLKANQGWGGGETWRGRMSKISRHVNPAVARYRSHSHPSLACSSLPPWMGAESRCSHWHLLRGCSWCSTWFCTQHDLHA